MERSAVARSSPSHAKPEFEHNKGLCGAGVLFLLPSLIEQGLFKTEDFYTLPDSHFYGVQSTVLTLAIMALARIKNPEQLKQCKPGELGRIIGLDRVPETKSLRNKLQLLTDQKQAKSLNNELINHWYKQEDKIDDFALLYIDGHQRIYYGSNANLPKKFISRQKLCLSATTEYWVNDTQGMPLMVVSSELTEKMKTMIIQHIIPELKLTETYQTLLEKTPQTEPVLTLVFDREVYEPNFFMELWNQERIAIITYRKNVKDKWEENLFESVELNNNNKTTMLLYEKEIVLGGHTFREVRRLSESAHQTAIITTHPSMSIVQIAQKMFYRWTQENFFKYMIANYEFDKMIGFGVEPVQLDKMIVNPEYRKIEYQIRKIKDKKSRIQAKLYPLIELVMNQDIDQLPQITAKQQEYTEKINDLQQQENQLLKQRKETSRRITVAQMPNQDRYNKLSTENKLLMNVIKMICYRAETSIANFLASHLSRDKEEKRMLVKQIIANNADIVPDYDKQILEIRLHTLSAPRHNHAAEKLAILLTETETIFPQTNLKMVFKLLHL